MANFENKIVKEKQLDKGLKLTVKQNEMSGRIFVEFSSEDGKLVLQKSFPDTIDGVQDSERFQKSIKSTKALHKYFGITKPLSVKVREQPGEKNGPFKRSRRN